MRAIHSSILAISQSFSRRLVIGLICVAAVGCAGAQRRADCRAAVSELQSMAEQGEAEAQNCLAQLYFYGRGVPQSFENSFSWYQKAALQGDALAQFKVGWMYHTGKGVERDAAKAEDWYLKAARNGNAEAQYWLGDLYWRRFGNLYWLCRAAEQGQPEASRDIYIREILLGGRGSACKKALKRGEPS